MSSAENLNFSHHVGKDAKEVQELIQKEHPELKVYIVPQDAAVTMDYRVDRVRLFIDSDGMVARTPHAG